jgi:hypothetical protein
MGRPSWRTVATAVLMPVSVLAGIVQPDDYLPKHGGVYVVVFLFLLGAGLGYRSVLLVLAAMVASFIWYKTQCVSNENCVYSALAFYLGPVLSIPAILGATLGWLARSFANPFAKPS